MITREDYNDLVHKNPHLRMPLWHLTSESVDRLLLASATTAETVLAERAAYLLTKKPGQWSDEWQGIPF